MATAVPGLRFGHVAFRVPDLERSIGWYEAEFRDGFFTFSDGSYSTSGVHGGIGFCLGLGSSLALQADVRYAVLNESGMDSSLDDEEWDTTFFSAGLRVGF